MNSDVILSELNFSTSLSGGKGGQHVNKVATKVTLFFSVSDSEGLDDQEKSRILKKLNKTINKEGKLVMACDETRSQFRNKKIIQQRFLKKLQEALKNEKKRLKLKPTKAMVKKRLSEKKQLQEKKQRRRRDNNPEL